MKKLCVFILLILAFSSAITAQVKTKKVAILETVDKENKVEYGVELQLRGYLTDAINRTPGYEGYDRVDMASILGEHNFQRTGLVSDAQIKKLGEMTGASSIIVAEAAMYGSDRIIIIAKIIDVETARIENTARPKVASTSDDGMAKACAELAIELLGMTNDTRNGNGGRSGGNAYTSSNSTKGIFSVGPYKKVHFAKGNLQYQASTGTWRFAENQWDIIGEENKNIKSPDYNGWIDLFGWGTGNNPTKCSNNSSDYVSFNEWGNNSILNSENKKWFTPTEEEWEYVFNKRRTNSGARYAKATVNGVNGVILLPDNWNSDVYDLQGVNIIEVDYTSNRIAETIWNDVFDSNGACFLPAAGDRINKVIYGCGKDGCYWSATYYGNERAYNLNFLGGFLGVGRGCYTMISDGCSVRLVSLVE